VKQLLYHKIPEKIERLQQFLVLGEWSPTHHVEYEKIDQLVTEAMLHAERLCSKKYTNTFQWSPQMIQAVQRERYWRTQLKATRGKSTSPKALERLKEAAGFHEANYQPTLQQVIDALRKSKSHQKEMQSRHIEMRETYLERLATSIVLKSSPHLDDPKYEQRLKKRITEAVRRILKKERQRNMYRAIGATLNKRTDNVGGISRIDIPAPPAGINASNIDPKT